MPHVLSLSDAQKAVLYSPHVPVIGLRVVMRGLIKLVTATADDGTLTFGSEYQAKEIDISNRVKLGTGIRISTQKPILPTGKGNSSRGANVKLTLINTDEYFSVTQDGSILSAEHIQDAYIDIYSTFGGEELLMYSGRVIGRPTEKRGETILTIRDSMMGIVDNPVAYYNGSQTAKIYFENGELFTPSAGFGSLRIESYAAGAYFNQEGRVYPTITNSDPDKIDLTEIDIRPAFVSPISKYEIIFTGARQFTVIFPTSPPEIGSVDEDFDKNNLRINKEYWRIPGDNKLVIDVADIVLDDLTGVELSFFACYTVKGNPIAICKHLLDKAFRGGKATSINNAAFPVDWDRLDELEKMYDGYTLFVSETNKNPSVYDPASTQRPLSYKNILETVLEHIDCALIINTEGKISISSSYLLESEKVYDITSDMIQDHEFIGNITKYDRLRVRYGHDLISGAWTSESIFEGVVYEDWAANTSYPAGKVVKIFGLFYIFNKDYIAGSLDLFTSVTVITINEYEINYRYFKTGRHLRRIESKECGVVPRVWNHNIQVSLKALPNHGLSLEAGDKVRLIFSHAPRKSEMYVEIYSVNKRIGGDVVIKCVKIETPEHPVELCETELCVNKIY